MADPVLTLTDDAVARIRDIRAGEPGAERLALWVEVTGAAGDDYRYDLWLQDVGDAGEGDAIQQQGDVPVVVPKASADRLRGATLAVGADGSLVMRNPNRPPRPASPLLGPPPGDLEGPVAERVLQVLERQVNPGLATHGGRADLVSVDGDTAYITLSGGCMGCGLAGMTLAQGIEVALREAVPEIERVVDVTNHAAGTNPYYERAQ